MKLYTDHYFHIGFAHLGSGKPCQDYCISQEYKEAALAVVADGCSTGRNTDVGSRILSLATITAMRDHRDLRRRTCSIETPFEISVRQEIVLAGSQKILNLEVSDMLSTCIYAYISPEGGFIQVKGDGVIALKSKDGKILASNFEWEDNTPYYPAYKNGSLDKFIEAHGNDLGRIRFNEEAWVIKDKGDCFLSETNEYTLAEGIEGVTVSISEQELKEELEFVAIFSDGVTQVDGLDWREAVFNFMNFKSLKGEFAKRRMIREIKNISKKSKGPLDDISYAVIRIDNEN